MNLYKNHIHNKCYLVPGDGWVLHQSDVNEVGKRAYNEAIADAIDKLLARRNEQDIQYCIDKLVKLRK